MKDQNQGSAMHIPRTHSVHWALYLAATGATAALSTLGARRLHRSGPLVALVSVLAVDEGYRRTVDYLFPLVPKYHPADTAD